MKLNLWQKIATVIYLAIQSIIFIFVLPFNKIEYKYNELNDNIDKSTIVIYNSLWSEYSNINIERVLLEFVFSTIVFLVIFFILHKKKEPDFSLESTRLFIKNEFQILLVVLLIIISPLIYCYTYNYYINNGLTRNFDNKQQNILIVQDIALKENIRLEFYTEMKNIFEMKEEPTPNALWAFYQNNFSNNEWIQYYYNNILDGYWFKYGDKAKYFGIETKDKFLNFLKKNTFSEEEINRSINSKAELSNIEIEIKRFNDLHYYSKEEIKYFIFKTFVICFAIFYMSRIIIYYIKSFYTYLKQ